MDTLKIIDTQQKFANRVYLDFTSKRFGITPCCLKDSQSIIIKKQICDWQESKIHIPEIASVTSEIFIPSDVQDPCADSNAPDWCIACSNNPPNIAELEEKLVGLKNELEEVEDSILQATEEKTALQGKLEKVQAEKNSYETLLVDLQTQLKSAVFTRDDLVFQYDAGGCLNDPQPDPVLCTTLETQIKDQDQIIDKLEVSISDTESNIKDLTADINEVNGIIAEIDAVISKYNDEKDSIEEKIRNTQSQFCVDDAECILIEVIDSSGVPVENFELYIDGGNSGFTDSNGQYRFTITNASIDTNHTLQICYCFSTEGGCRQQKIN